jgi:hypothetical protein
MFATPSTSSKIRTGHYCPSPGPGGKQREGGLVLRALCDGVVAVGHGRRGHAGPCRACPAHRAGVAVTARAAGLEPGMPRCRALGQAQQRPWGGASGVAAAIVWRLSPVEAQPGRLYFGDGWLHG